MSDLYSGVILVSFCDLENVYACSIYLLIFLDINNSVSGLSIFGFHITGPKRKAFLQWCPAGTRPFPVWIC